MKQITKASQQPYSHPEVEKTVTALTHELDAISTIQVKEDAPYEMTFPLFQLKVFDTIKSLGQTAMNSIKGILQAPALINSTNEKERINSLRIRALRTEHSDMEIHRSIVQREADAIHIDKKKKRYGLLVAPVAITCGLGDAVLAFLALSQSYSKTMAIIAAAAIGLSIAVAHFGYVPWIKQALSIRGKLFRSSIVLITALILFGFLSNIRASALNTQTASIAGNQIITTVSNTPINGWAVCGISFTLFLIVFFLSLVLWRSKEERLLEEKKQELLIKVAVLNKEIKQNEEAILKLENEIAEQKAYARNVHAYAVNSMVRCRTFCIQAVIDYKKNFLRYSPHPIPDFFINDVEFHFNEILQEFSLPQTEAA